MNRSGFGVTVILLLATCWLLLYRLGAPNFYDLRDESRRALVAREMLDAGDWITPRLEGKTTLTKPPVYYWAAMLCSGKTVTEGSARLPSAAAGVGTVLLTMLIGSLLFDRRTGLAAGLVLATTSFFIHQSRQAEMDAMLTLCTTAAVYCFLKAYYNPERAGRWFTLCWAAMACGMMTKGPFALTFPLLPGVLFLWRRRELRPLGHPRFWGGAALFFAVCLPWPLLVMREHPDFLRVALVETAGRAVTGFTHREPPLFYFEQLISMLFPWIFVFPFAVWLTWSRKRLGRTPAHLFLLLWFFANLIALSLMQSKRDVYLLPIFPAAALLTAAALPACCRWLQAILPGAPAVRKRACFGLGAACAAGALLSGKGFAMNIPGPHFPATAALLLLAGFALMSLVILKALFASLRLHTAVLLTAAAAMLGAQFLYCTCTVPIRNTYDSGKQFYRTASAIAKGHPLGFESNYESYTFSFYAGRPVATGDAAEGLARLAAAGTRCYLVRRGKDFARTPAANWKPVFASPFAEHRSWKGLVLLGSGTPAAPAAKQ